MKEKFLNWWRLDKDEEALTADSVLAPLSWAQRRKALSLVSVSFGWGFCITGMFVGSLVATEPTGKDMLMSVIIGNTILFCIAFLVTYPAYRTGCCNSLLYKLVFGSKGWVLPCLIVIITGLGWQGSLTGMFPDVIVGAGNTGYAIVGLIGGALVLYSCYKGIRGLEFVGNLAVVFLCFAGIACIAYNLKCAGGLDGLMELANEKNKDNPDGLTMVGGVDAIVGSWAVGAMFAGDFTRFSKTGISVLAFIGVCFVIVQPFLQVLGITGAVVHGEHVFTGYAMQLGMVFFVVSMIAMVMAIWTTANSNMYFTQVQFSNITRRPMKVSAVIIGIIGAVAAAWGFFNYFGGFINTIVSLVPPMLGPIACDYFICNKMKYDPAIIDKVPPFNWGALVAYVSGVVIPRFYVPESLPIAIWNIVISAVFYLAIFYICKAAGKPIGYASVADQGEGPYNPKARAIANGEYVS
ncbi:MAG: cytosine permease [Lentihominibacter sp.]